MYVFIYTLLIDSLSYEINDFQNTVYVISSILPKSFNVYLDNAPKNGFFAAIIWNVTLVPMYKMFKSSNGLFSLKKFQTIAFYVSISSSTLSKAIFFQGSRM